MREGTVDNTRVSALSRCPFPPMPRCSPEGCECCLGLESLRKRLPSCEPNAVAPKAAMCARDGECEGEGDGRWMREGTVDNTQVSALSRCPLPPMPMCSLEGCECCVGLESLRKRMRSCGPNVVVVEAAMCARDGECEEGGREQMDEGGHSGRHASECIPSLPSPSHAQVLTGGL